MPNCKDEGGGVWVFMFVFFIGEGRLVSTQVGPCVKSEDVIVTIQVAHLLLICLDFSRNPSATYHEKENPSRPEYVLPIPPTLSLFCDLLGGPHRHGQKRLVRFLPSPKVRLETHSVLETHRPCLFCYPAPLSSSLSYHSTRIYTAFYVTYLAVLACWETAALAYMAQPGREVRPRPTRQPTNQLTGPKRASSQLCEPLGSRGRSFSFRAAPGEGWFFPQCHQTTGLLLPKEPERMGGGGGRGKTGNYPGKKRRASRRSLRKQGTTLAGLVVPSSVVVLGGRMSLSSFGSGGGLLLTG